MATGALTFEIGGTDETGATLRETQAAVDRRLSPHLPRVLFLSQASVMGLLEAADSKFKEALAPVVDLTLWKVCSPVTSVCQHPSPCRLAGHVLRFILYTEHIVIPIVSLAGIGGSQCCQRH